MEIKNKASIRFNGQLYTPINFPQYNHKKTQRTVGRTDTPPLSPSRRHHFSNNQKEKLI